MIGAAVFLLAGLLAAGLLISASSSKEASPEPDALLQRLAAGTTLGWVDDQRPQAELEQRFNDGERLFITCGTISTLAQRMLAAEGVESRLVSTLTRGAFNGKDDGHTMIEVRTGEGWALYDLIDNRMAVDGAGREASFVEQIQAGHDRRWRVLSDDKFIDFRAASPGARRVTIETLINKGLRVWYDRVLGTPTIETAPGSGDYVFNDPSQRERVESYSSAYRWVGQTEWREQVEG